MTKRGGKRSSARRREQAGPSDAERELFERAVREIEHRDRSGLLRAKGAGDQGQEPPVERSPRLDKIIRREGFEPEASLDLHGLDRERALQILERFLGEQRGKGAVIVLVIHGKGRRILARKVLAALDVHPAVAEHLTAPRRLGSSGARVVRLRRSG